MNKIKLSAPITKSISRGLFSNLGSEAVKLEEEDSSRRIGRSMASLTNTVFAFRSTLSLLTSRFEQENFPSLVYETSSVLSSKGVVARHPEMNRLANNFRDFPKRSGDKYRVWVSD